ncbi:helix-turn-helix transcriptional regulator [Flavobacterium supellecticarium]|uniref:Helix-turn-helix transcriptional regulator n=1 Tax=Flavobacterium supellecticarium TaxID=2565924 RepID=A0A4V3W847_9FLAO|nr:AraC family transcriptional regulator [Flavobacterium supellecticarium]THF49830.1 helix-turn-helix transcriptional regulator [Flavobacterium supellecticarium]
MDKDFQYQFREPEPALADYIESIGMFFNPSDQEKEVVVMPDGRVDLFFSQTGTGTIQTLLLGLETYPEQRSVPPQTRTFVISFKPLGAEYILQQSIASLLNTAANVPDDFWDFNTDDLRDFETFHKKATQKITERLPQKTDIRKHQLFELIYTSKGEMSVAELSEKTAWNSRQINRYFNRQFGLSLKAFCTIFRFRASLEHIAQGKLFPELNFTDQNHFIKEIKKFSGVVPSELSKNQNDRFILVSVLKQR